MTTRTSRYVCREHYTSVNWRGTGCTTCDERRMTRTAKRIARAENEFRTNRQPGHEWWTQ